MCKRLPIRFLFIASLLFCCIHQLKAQQDWAKKQLDSLLNVLPKLKEDSAKARTLMYIAQNKMGEAQNTGNWDDAIEWAKKGLQHSKKSNFRFGIRRCNWQLGQSYTQIGDYPEAHRYYTETLNASLRDKIVTPIVISYTWLGRNLMLLGNYEEALKNLLTGFNKCEEHFSEIVNKVIVRARLIMFIGDSYSKLNKYSEAITWYEKLLADKQIDILWTPYVKIALVQIETKNYDEALKNLQTAIRTLPNLLNRNPDYEINGLLGEYYKQIGEAYCKLGLLQKNTERITTYNEAINYLTKSLTLLKQGTGGKEILMEAYALLKEACEAVNDYQTALYYSNHYNYLKNSIYNKTTYLKLADQKIKFETEKAALEMKARQEKEKLEQDVLRDKTLADQKMEEERKLTAQKLEQEKVLAIASEKANYEKSMAVEKIRSEKQQTNNLLLMGLILVVVTSVFLMLYLRQRHQKKRAVEKAESIHKMAELELQN